MNINSASESSQDLDKSFSSFNASSRQIKMEEGENGKPMDDINVRTGVILSTSAPENTTYHQRLTHALMGESVHLHQDNAAGEARRHTTKIYDDCEIASNDGSDYSGCFSNDEEEKEEEAPDFGHYRHRALEMNQGPHHEPSIRMARRNSLDNYDVGASDLWQDAWQANIEYGLRDNTDGFSRHPPRRQSLNQSVASSLQSDTEDGDDHVYGTYVLDMSSNGPASITPRTTDRMQRRGTMETAHTTGTHETGDLLSIPDGSNDGNTETLERDHHNSNYSPAREGIFFTIKMGLLILLTCCARSDPEDDVAEAVHIVGGKTQPLAAPAKIAPPPSAAE
jgi:hypothetical protein